MPPGRRPFFLCLSKFGDQGDLFFGGAAAVGGVDAEAAALGQDGGRGAHDLGQRRLDLLDPGVAVVLAVVIFGKFAAKVDSQREVSLLDVRHVR
jgi:hypothetical protein